MAETVLDTLVVKIRADTRELDQGLAAAMTSLSGLERVAGEATGTTVGLGAVANGMTLDLDRTTEAATRRMGAAFERLARSGRLSFESLKDAALTTLAQIVAGYLSAGLERLFQAGAGGLATMFTPGRAGGGTVAGGQPYIVGERGPELFVPATAGRIVTQGESAGRRADPRERVPQISITINTSGGESEGRRSAAQVALAVQRALARAERAL